MRYVASVHNGTLRSTLLVREKNSAAEGTGRMRLVALLSRALQFPKRPRVASENDIVIRVVSQTATVMAGAPLSCPQNA